VTPKTTLKFLTNLSHLGTYFEDHFSAIEDTIKLFSSDALKEITCLMALPEHVYSPVQGFASPFEYDLFFSSFPLRSSHLIDT
jgi:hypothetical protein